MLYALTVQFLLERELYLQEEDKESCRHLTRLCPPNLKNLEQLSLEVFEEDEEDEMRLLSVRDMATCDVVGYILWRNVPSHEIHEWVKLFSSPCVSN
jgi:hypothetical protein